MKPGRSERGGLQQYPAANARFLRCGHRQGKRLGLLVACRRPIRRPQPPATNASRCRMPSKRPPWTQCSRTRGCLGSDVKAVVSRRGHRRLRPRKAGVICAHCGPDRAAARSHRPIAPGEISRGGRGTGKRPPLGAGHQSLSASTATQGRCGALARPSYRTGGQAGIAEEDSLHAGCVLCNRSRTGVTRKARFRHERGLFRHAPSRPREPRCHPTAGRCIYWTTAHERCQPCPTP